MNGPKQLQHNSRKNGFWESEQLRLISHKKFDTNSITGARAKENELVARASESNDISLILFLYLSLSVVWIWGVPSLSRLRQIPVNGNSPRIILTREFKKKKPTHTKTKQKPA